MTFVFILSVLFLDAQSIRLEPYFQARSIQYATGAPEIPRELAGSIEAIGSDDARWRGTPDGVWREDPKAKPEDRTRYFSSRRWLPDDKVLALHPDNTRGMWVKTESGAAHIEFVRMTLVQKAALFEERVAKRHNRHGFVADSALQKPGDLSTSQPRTSDNDGLWTAMYAAAECYRYAVTRSPEALRLAKQSVEAILELEEITGIPGLPARSYLTPDESRPRDGIWVWNPSRTLQWKADTSSDEIAGHFYIFGIAYDLLPDVDLKRRIAATAGRIMDRILDNGLTLTDLHGQPTYWGRWDKEYFASERGRSDSPLQAVEILSFLKTAHHITGTPRYQSEYLRLANADGYKEIAGRYVELREQINYSDEELAMLSFQPLLVYERDPNLLKAYRKAIDGWWENERREKNPLWILIYQLSKPPQRPNLAEAVWTLQRTPLDLVQWTIRNNHRKDVAWEGAADRFGRRQTTTLLPPDERPVMKWNGNPFRVDGGNNGGSEDDGAFYLLPYWMGRYYRYLVE